MRSGFTPSAAPSPRIFEREGELRDLAGLLASAEAGEATLGAVTGPAGIGKTALLAEAGRHAETRGFRVLRARGHELERAFPFGCAVQLFSTSVADEPQTTWDGPAALARPLLERAEPGPPPEDPDAAFPLLHGLHWLTHELSERAPLLLLVDDAQWSDAATLRLLHYLMQRADGLRAAIAIGVRDGEPVDDATGMVLAALAGHPLASHLPLRPLEPASIGVLVRDRVPDAADAFVAACAEVSGGNPFLVREVVLAAEQEGVMDAESVRALHPGRIELSLVDRLRRLGDPATRLAEAAAILRPGSALDLVADLAGLPLDTATVAADLLAQAEVLAVDGGIDFVHPVLRTVVYEHLPGATRRRRHAEAARLLKAHREEAHDVAAQLALCDPLGDDWVVPVLRNAAREAARTGAAEVACAHLRRALQEPGAAADPGALLDLGLVEANLGNPAALEHLEVAARLADAPSDRLRALSGLIRARYGMGDGEGALRTMQQGLQTVPPGAGGVEEGDLLLFGFAGALYDPSLHPAARSALAIPRATMNDPLTPGEVARRVSLAYMALLMGHRATSAEALAPLTRLLQTVQGPRGLPVYSLPFFALSLLFAGRYGEAVSLVGPPIEEARRSADRLLLGTLVEGRATALHRGGRLRAAALDFEGIREPIDLFPARSLASRCVWIDCLLDRGARDDAAGLLSLPDGIEDAVARVPGGLFLPWIRARVEALEGNFTAALEQAELCGERLDALHMTSPDFLSWRSRAAPAAHALGDRDRALALAAEELAIARRIESPISTGIALRTWGTIEGGVSGLEALREAVPTLDATEARLEQTRARFALGVALRHAGYRRDARSLLTEAMQRARDCGAKPLAEQALAEVRLAGGRPRRFVESGVDSLTPAQHRVAELAAQGRTNKQIAASLFVTLRTVETHLTEVYRRLGITSRNDLSGALGGSEEGEVTAT